MPILLLVAAGLLFAAWYTWRSANTMWVIEVEDGRIARIVGRPPVGFVSAVREVVAFPPVARARLVARKGEQAAVLEVQGLDPGRRQRLQNVFRLQPQSSFRGTPNPINEDNAHRAYTLARLLSFFRRRW